MRAKMSAEINKFQSQCISTTLLLPLSLPLRPSLSHLFFLWVFNFISEQTDQRRSVFLLILICEKVAAKPKSKLNSDVKFDSC